MKKQLLSLALALLLLLNACATADRPLTAAELLDLGEKYLLEQSYEQALIQFTKLIEIEPMNPRGYTGAAEAYVGLGQQAEAIEILQKGYKLIGDDSIKNMLLALGIDEDSIPFHASTDASEPDISDDGNLTGRTMFSLEDLEAWGYPHGMKASDILASELYQRYHPNQDTWNEKIWVGTGANAHSECVISHVQIEDDSIAGPRGVKVGMSYEEIISLFRCDNPDALLDGSNPGGNHSIRIYNNRQSEQNLGQYAHLSFSSENDGYANLSYEIQYYNEDGTNSNEGCSLYFNLQNGAVSSIYISYHYDEHADFEAIMMPNQEPPELIDFNSITFLGRGLFDIFNSDIFTIADTAKKYGFMMDASSITNDDDSDHWYYSSPFSDWSCHISALQNKISPHVNLLGYGHLGYTQVGKIGIGDIDMSDSLSTVLTKWGFADGEGMAEYLLSFTGKPLNEFRFEWDSSWKWNHGVDNYRISISTYPSGGSVEDTNPFNGAWSLAFAPVEYEKYTLVLRFDNDRFVEYYAHRDH